MSDDDRFASLDDQDAARSKPVGQPKGSGCWKWGLIFTAIGGVGMLVCCGVMAFIGYQMGTKMVMTPPEVDALAQTITDITIPDTLRGEMGMSMQNPLFDMQMCLFRETSARGQMQLMQFNFKIGDPAQNEAQFKQEMDKQKNAEMKELNVEETVTRDVVIRGEPTTFTFIKGKDVATSTDYREVKGQFKGKSGTAVLHLQLEAEVYDEAAIDAMLESIK